MSWPVKATVAVVAIGALFLILESLIPSLRVFHATVQQNALAAEPEEIVKSYVHAVARGDEPVALAIWQLPEQDLGNGISEALSTRRKTVTRYLRDARIRPEPRIDNVEWWRTCCEPDVIPNSTGAGGARLRVQMDTEGNEPLLYYFDVFARERTDTLAPEVIHWALRDVYATNQAPLFWRYVFEPHVRWLTPEPMNP